MARAILGLLLALVALPVQAVSLMGEAAPEAQPAPAASPAQAAIELDRAADQDERIAARLSEIFANVPSLAQVEVSASDGVVTLSGLVPDDAAAARAEAIAAGVEGVATVENALERDTAVDFEEGIGGFGERLEGFIDMLPLIGSALVVALVIIAFGYLLASLSGIWHRLAPNSFLAELITSAIRFIFVILGVVVALDMVGAGTLMGAVRAWSASRWGSPCATRWRITSPA